MPIECCTPLYFLFCTKQRPVLKNRVFYSITICGSSVRQHPKYGEVRRKQPKNIIQFSTNRILSRVQCIRKIFSNSWYYLFRVKNIEKYLIVRRMIAGDAKPE